MNREEFLNQIEQFLIENSFDNKDEGIFVRKMCAKTQPQTVIINNKRMDIPPKDVNVELIVNLIGEGYINEGCADEESFELIQFIISQNDKISLELNNNFYYNEIDLFKQYCKIIFKI